MTSRPAAAASQGLVPTPLFVLGTHACPLPGLHRSNLSLPPWEYCDFVKRPLILSLSRHCDLAAHWLGDWLFCLPLRRGSSGLMSVLFPAAVQSHVNAFALAVPDRKHRMHSTEG